MKNKEISKVLGGTVLVNCDVDEFDATADVVEEFERVMLMVGEQGPIRRHGRGLSGSGEDQIVLGFSLPFEDTRTTSGTNDCVHEVDEARRTLERKLSFWEAYDVNGVTFELLAGECHERTIVRMVQKAASSRSRSRSWSRRSRK
jgi:hypothetical protein